MKLRIGVVLLAAFAIEMVNFAAGGAYALDPGNSSATPWPIQLVAMQWGIVHAAGLYALDYLERGGTSLLPSSHHALLLPHWGEMMVIFFGGYLSTALLLTIIMLGVQRFLRWNRRRSAQWSANAWN